MPGVFVSTFRAVNKNDPGGKTKYGITEATLGEYFRTIGRPGEEPLVKDLTREQAGQIYRQMYFEKNKIGDIRDEGTANHVFDMVINPGPGGGGRLVQQALNEVTGATLKVDGQIGDKTIAALNNATPEQLRRLNSRMADLRAQYYEQRAKEDPRKEIFLPGWYRRANKYRGPAGVPAEPAN